MGAPVGAPDFSVLPNKWYHSLIKDNNVDIWPNVKVSVEYIFMLVEYLASWTIEHIISEDTTSPFEIFFDFFFKIF